MKIKKNLYSKLTQLKQWGLYVIKCHFFLYKKTFHYQPFIYLDDDGLVLSGDIGDRLKWLADTYIINSYCSDNAMKIAKDKLSKVYKGNLDDVWYF